MAEENNTISWTGFVEEFEYSGNLVIYHGRAKPGTATSSPGWQIRKFTYSGILVTEIKYASGNSKFDKTWDSRATYDYS